MYGNLHGKGKYIFKDEVIYEGEFYYNSLTGIVKFINIGKICFS